MKLVRVAFGLGLSVALAQTLVIPPAGAGANKPPAIRSSHLRAIRLAPNPQPATTPRANWLSAGNMNTAVAETGGGAFLGGKLYVPGGFLAGFGSVYDRMQIYTASTNTWTTDSERMPGPLLFGVPGWADAAICAGMGRVFVVNGLDGQLLYSAFQIYDTTAPAGARWSLGPYPATSTTNVFFSQASGCAVIGTKLYLFAGFAAIGDPNDPSLVARPSGATWVWDMRTGVWSDTGRVMTTARFWHGYAGGSQGAVAAGGTNNTVNFLPTPTAERFTPSGGWSSLPNMPAGRLALGMGIIDVGGFKAAVFGGQDSGGVKLASTLTCALPTCSAWMDANLNLTFPRSFFAWGSTTNNLYAAGGQNALGLVIASAEKAA